MKVSRRQFVRVGAGALAVAASGCDNRKVARFLGIGPTKVEITGPLDAPAGADLDEVSHAINRLTFGPRPGDYARVKAMGVAAFIDEQLAPEKIDDDLAERIIRPLESLETDAGDMFDWEEKYLLSEMTRATLLRATYTRRQLYEVMVHFWSDHFNIDPSKGDCRWLKAADDRDVIRTHALGSFPELLRATALSPAMLWYLDGRVNRRAHPEDKPNENYARELLELHTLGVHGGYTQQDVMEAARCLTGWTVRHKEFLGNGRVEFRAKDHDDGAKTVLGVEIPAGGGEKDIDRLLEIVAFHPSSARHIATKLCARFIADAPPAEAIEPVAKAFADSRGDIKATLRALFSTQEFQTTRGNKLKRPLHFVVSSLRATNAQSNAAEGDPGAAVIAALPTEEGRRRKKQERAPGLTDYLLRMGHAPFRYPTPDGYPEEATHWQSSLLWRWNFAVALCENRLKGTQVDVEELREKLGGDAAIMATALGRQPTADETQAFTQSGDALALLLASPGFQRC
jgi:uncharacterized protein (DUF1800 family)